MTRESSECINLARGILLIGVVMIHCNVAASFDAGEFTAAEVVDFITFLCSCCVPCYFMISGYLFFNTIDRFDIKVFGSKLKRRVYSLLIPYLLWCSVYAIVRILKAKYLGYDSLGLLSDGNISLKGVVISFWETSEGYPIGFVLWFIRNLMVFMAFTPAIYFVARNIWLTILTLILIFVLGTPMEGFEYFLLGACLGMYKIDFSGLLYRKFAYAALFLFAILSVFIYLEVLNYSEAYFFWRLAFFYSFLSFLKYLYSMFPKLVAYILQFSGAFFFIYAVHGLYSKLVSSACVRLLGTYSDAAIGFGFLLSLIINILASAVIFLIVYKTFPRLTAILCGGR